MADILVYTTSSGFGQLPSELSTLLSYAAAIVPTASTLDQIENGIAYDVGMAFYSAISQISADQIISESTNGSSVTVQTPSWTINLNGSVSGYGSDVTKWTMTDSHGDTLTLTGSLQYSGLPVVSPLISGSHIDSVMWSTPSPINTADTLIGSINTAAYYSGGLNFSGSVSSFTTGLIDSLDQKAYVVTYGTSQSIVIPADGSGVSISDGVLNNYSIGITNESGAETDYAYFGSIALDLAAASPQQNLLPNTLAGNDVVSIAGSGALNVLAILPNEDTSAVGFTIYDSAENLQANLGLVETLAQQGKLASITLTDRGTPTISLTASAQRADAQALAKIVTPYTTSVLPCYVAGTRIATLRGEVPVEHLHLDDPVRLASGETARIVWLGYRRVDCNRHPRRGDVLPVRVSAHAFGLGRPKRNLYLSPDHAVFVDGVLIPIRYLLNAATVRQENVSAVTYWHVELAAHGVLLAEGLPAESYLDTGNRSAFANSGTVVMAHPEFARAVWATRACAPLVTAGGVRDLVYRRLLAQALALGWRTRETQGDEVRWLPPGTHIGDASAKRRATKWRST